MQIKHIYIFLSFVFCFFFTAQSTSYPQYRQSYFEQEHQIDISYSAKKHSLTRDYEIIVKNNGDMILLQSNDYSNKPKIIYGKLSEGELEGLKEFIIKANVSNFDNEYLADNDFIALDSERIKITIDGRAKDVLISSSSVPPKLQAIINAVKKYRARLLSNAAKE
ncbi:MAG: hypothetical protein WC412_08860 [Candidatus Omnitrophota bacterium]|jgi:hypothetical protein